MEATVDGLWNQIVSSRVLSSARLGELRDRWFQEAGVDAGNYEHFQSWLLREGYLTEYQVGVLVRGHLQALFLGQYKLLDRIGRGKMAGVYKAVHELGQTVAIKVLPPSRAKDGDSLARFLREARLALRLKHPNVVRTFQKGESAGVHFIVMEYLEGETLEDVLQRRGKLPPVEAVRLIYQALQGLQHIHEQNMVHRDLKPANLMLVPLRDPAAPDTTHHATVKILDIGVGRALFDEGLPGEDSEMELTVRGDMLGLPAYMAPEQARDAHQADIRSDIYTLGCVLYEALSGKTPFPPVSLAELGKRIPVARPLQEVAPEVPGALRQTVERMLAVDPAQRFATPEQAAQALRHALAAKPEAMASANAPAHNRSYLQWVESQSDPDIATVDVSEPAKRPRSGLNLAPTATKPRSGLNLKPRSGINLPRPAAEAADPADVLDRLRAKAVQARAEQAVKPEPAPAPKPTARPSSSGRDFLFFALGAGTGVVATLAIGGAVWAVVYFYSR